MAISLLNCKFQEQKRKFKYNIDFKYLTEYIKCVSFIKDIEMNAKVFEVKENTNEKQSCQYHQIVCTISDVVVVAPNPLTRAYVQDYFMLQLTFV